MHEEKNLDVRTLVDKDSVIHHFLLPKQATTRLSVFKARKAELKRAMFQTQTLKGTQRICDLREPDTTRVLYCPENGMLKVFIERGSMLPSATSASKQFFYAT
jgi:hypothetical protein